MVPLSPHSTPGILEPAPHILVVLCAPNVEDRRKEARHQAPDAGSDLEVDGWNKKKKVFRRNNVLMDELGHSKNLYFRNY